MKSRYKTSRRILIFWTLFIGVGALAGATGMLSDPTGKAMGMDEMLPYFQVLPFADIMFQDFTFSGFALLIVNGFTNLTAFTLLLINKKRCQKLGVILGTTFGVTLMLWICIQFYMFPLNFMSTIYFIFGLLQAITGYACWVFLNQEIFMLNNFTVQKSKKTLIFTKFDSSKYHNISTDKSLLVVYFSRMGSVSKLAHEIADNTGAEILEVTTPEPTIGTKGFWWCGRFAMHRWNMTINDIQKNINSYSKVTICCPIWVFDLASPIKTFCEKYQHDVDNVDIYLVHHRKKVPKTALFTLNNYFGTSIATIYSAVNRFGKIRRINIVKHSHKYDL